MYKTFRVKNFRCFKDLQINDLGRVNLIAGKNNTGKTALLEAISVYCGDRKAGTLLRADQELYLRSSAFDLGSFSILGLDSIFHNYDTSVRVEIRLYPDDGKGDSTKSSLLYMSYVAAGSDKYEKAMRKFPEGAFDYARVGDSNRYKSVDLVEISYSDNEDTVNLMVSEGELHIDRYASVARIPSAFVRALGRFPIDSAAKQFSNLRQSGGIKALTHSLQSVEPNLTAIELLYDGHHPQIYVEIGLPKLISLRQMGDGINRLTSILLAMSEIPNGLMFIDEIENGFHHSVQTDIWRAIGKLAERHNVQVFATTHSLEMIRAAYEAFKDDDEYEFRYHRLDRKPDGNIEAVTYNKYGMDAVAAFDFEYEVRG